MRRLKLSLTILIAETVGSPDATLASTPVNTVDKTETLSLLGIRTIICRIAQQTGGHARPACEDNKRKEVAHGHCSSAGFVESRTSSYSIGLHTTSGITSVSSGGEIV